jgi:hypothetical protein
MISPTQPVQFLSGSESNQENLSPPFELNRTSNSQLDDHALIIDTKAESSDGREIIQSVLSNRSDASNEQGNGSDEECGQRIDYSQFCNIEGNDTLGFGGEDETGGSEGRK